MYYWLRSSSIHDGIGDMYIHSLLELWDIIPNLTWQEYIGDNAVNTVMFTVKQPNTSICSCCCDQELYNWMTLSKKKTITSI